MAINKSALAGAIVTDEATEQEMGEAEAASFKFVFGRPPYGQYFIGFPEYTADLWFYIRNLGASAREFYLVVDPEAQRKYRTRLTALRCALVVDEDGVIYVWHVNSRLKNNLWVDSALECIGLTEAGPIEISSNDEGYLAHRPPEGYEFPEVFLPKMELGVVEVVAEALGDRHIINAVDHPQLARLGTPVRRQPRKEVE
jgi:hypothetical protein